MKLNNLVQFSGGTLTIGNFSMSFSLSGIVEMIIFSIVIYYIILWIKRTKAWNLLKGAGLILAAYIIARLFRLNTIVSLFENALSSVLIALIVILQPELRRALEQLGERNRIMSGLFSFGDRSGNVLTPESIDSIVRAMTSLGHQKIGALILLERNIDLKEFIETGITLNADISSALLEQIFEHNTPLHDGAVIIRNNRITAATCYLPLTKNTDVSKELGTRHRAGLGASESTDCITLIASEETGALSIAINGKLSRNVTPEQMTEVLTAAMEKNETKKKLSEKIKEKLKGGQKHETED